MGNKNKYVSLTSSYVNDILKGSDISLVDVEFVKELDDYYLRVYIDKKGGVSIDDCTALSEKMNEILDREDYIDEPYIFEVSSSGDRPFKNDNDFERNIGCEIEVRTYSAVNKEKEFRGYLESFDKDHIVIKINDKEVITLDRSNLSLVRKAF
jgi:ribosome maturation factor RimP